MLRVTFTNTMMSRNRVVVTAGNENGNEQTKLVTTTEAVPKELWKANMKTDFKNPSFDCHKTAGSSLALHRAQWGLGQCGLSFWETDWAGI